MKRDDYKAVHKIRLWYRFDLQRFLKGIHLFFVSFRKRKVSSVSKEIKIALLMAASLFMDVMDGTIVTTALPKMAQTFNVSAATASLLVSTYMIAVAVFIPLSGWLAQRYGKKNIWLWAVVLFTLSSFGSAVAPNFTVLLIMRIVQGIAGL